MEKRILEGFAAVWDEFFPCADLPITFEYSADTLGAEIAEPAKEWRCIIAELARVRRGERLALGSENIKCGGAMRYLGYTGELREGFEYFLSSGIPGVMEGERYKNSPETVISLLDKWQPFSAPAKYAVFKRWDALTEADNPQVVIFFSPPDVLSGLFTLSGFEDDSPQSVIAPFAAGCGSIVYWPMRELESEKPRAVLGMFDVSARPYVPAGVLSFAVPFPLFERMVENARESFLITDSWDKVRRRIRGGSAEALV